MIIPQPEKPSLGYTKNPNSCNDLEAYPCKNGANDAIHITNSDPVFTRSPGYLHNFDLSLMNQYRHQNDVAICVPPILYSFESYNAFALAVIDSQHHHQHGIRFSGG